MTTDPALIKGRNPDGSRFARWTELVVYQCGHSLMHGFSGDMPPSAVTSRIAELRRMKCPNCRWEQSHDPH